MSSRVNEYLTTKELAELLRIKERKVYALAVLEGKADVAFGLQGVAHQYRLRFLPIMRERCDLFIDRRAWFEPSMQRFLSCCATAGFARKAQELMGYDLSGFGTVQLNGQ